MSDDIKAKLQSLKTLKGQMKNWKRDDLKRKKGIKQPEQKQTAKQDSMESDQEQSGEPESTLAKLIQKLVHKE